VRKSSHAMEWLPSLVGAGSVCAAGVLSWAAVAPSSQLFCRSISRTGDESSLALTFDDGPNPSVTPDLLNLLYRLNVHATFFLIGRNVRIAPELTRQISERGHVIGNHTETHPPLTFLSPRRIDAELSSCDAAIEDVIDKRVCWMRPPFGFRGPQLNSVVKRRGLDAIVMWSVWARDWKPQPAEPVIRRLRRVRGGDIVLLHDGDHRVLNGDRQHTVAALEYWLPRWIDAGFQFVTLDEIRSAG
jgi:peptidoglycan-N-acetylglucosamine deacetylase